MFVCVSLVDGRVTIADLSFITWYEIVPKLISEEEYVKFTQSYPVLTNWLNTLKQRPAVKKAFDEKARVNQPKH